jgi:hypothetical protein
MVSMTKYIPENLDVDSLIKSYPPPFPKFKRDKLVHIISLLYEIPQSKKDVIDTEQGWIPINTTKLQNDGIRDFPNYRDYLISTGILETNNHYIVGKKSKGFRLTDEYLLNKLKEVQITEFTLIKSIKKAKAKKYVPDQHKTLKEWFSPFLQIDADNARKCLDAKYHKEAKIDGIRAANKMNAGRFSIAKLNRGYFHFGVDRTSGRLHTNLSHMPKYLRYYLTYGNQKLVSIDIVNSQPFISTILFNPSFWVLAEKAKPNIYNDCNRLINYQSIENNKYNRVGIRVSTIMLAEYTKTLDTIDIIRYRKLAVNGGLYEYLENIISLKANDRKLPKSKRDLMKEMMFIVLFSENAYRGREMQDAKNAFETEFPNVYKRFKEIKQKDHTQLAILLQAIESEFILNRVCTRISRERPYLPLYTIHDSVATTLGNEDYVRTVMEEEAVKAFGYAPQLKNEEWFYSNQSKEVA